VDVEIVPFLVPDRNDGDDLLRFIDGEKPASVLLRQLEREQPVDGIGALRREEVRR
jgi:hypothetical protein